MTPRRERVHRATESSSAVDDSVDVGLSSASISPEGNVDGTPGLQHSSSSTFGCNQCSKVFNRRENLSRHLKTHDASPSHRCPKCDKAFTRSDLLKRHERGHERWDQKSHAPESANGYAKRRKVAFEDPGHQSLPESPSYSHRSPNYSHGHQIQDINHSSLHGEQDSFHELDPNDFVPLPETAVATTPAPPTFHNSSQASAPVFCSESDYLPFGPFDFSSFLLPPDTGPVGNEWFSDDFYSAMRETGNEWGGLGDLLDPNFLSPGQGDRYTSVTEASQNFNEPDVVVPNHPQDESSGESNEDRPPEQGRISRISSPPNEASEEDKWPFQWNPQSRAILKANPISIPDDHPLLRNHNHRYDISETTLLRLRAFLSPPAGREFHQSQKGSFILPSLPVINMFIGLFFERFSPQMPVIHHPTINTNSDLPPPLLAAMITIGAIYSHLKHTRRFSIVLLDIVRWNLQIALECDNSLMREPMIIYAETLICHTGLWCGNKRAFELAEVVRGAVVTYIRRKHFQDRGVSITQDSASNGNLNSQWRKWIAEESQRRLYWVIYALDAQFPALLNLPATIAIGEVSQLGCPCDEEFWCAYSARNWKKLLGPASVPPSRSFSAAVGPFVLSACFKSTVSDRSVHRQQDQLPVLNLNPWSSFLVLMTIQNQIFQLSQESLLARSFNDDEEALEGDEYSEEQSQDVNESSPGNIGSILKSVQIKRREQLADALSSWNKYYSPTASRTASRLTSQHFHAASIVVYHLSTILLDIELSDLQNAIGKDGTAGISQAMSNLRRWARKSPRIAENVAFNAVRTIVSLAPIRKIDDHSAPYSIIMLFLCHVVLWVFTSVSSQAEKQNLLDTIAANGELYSSHFFSVLKSSLSSDGDSNGLNKTDAPKLLFKSGAEMLTQLGTWGASLNLALLIHRRAEMQ